MTSITRGGVLFLATLLLLVSVATAADPSAPASRDSSLPHLDRRGNVTQLIVDGKPYLILGGELGNSTASGAGAIDSIWPRLQKLHLNTVIAPVYWELLEPNEGKFDFSLVDHLIDGARANDMRLVLLWFGVWKNSMSSYAPAWMKHDWKRFPRVIKKDGNATEILSPFAVNNLTSDVAAFTRFMRHLREYDGERHTVVIVQVENEIGMIPDARDHSPAADEAFEKPVPKKLIDHLHAAGEAIAPELKRRWTAAGGKDAGTWADVFGKDALGEEVFTAWHFATFVNELVRAGTAEYPLPMYVNAALNRPGRAPGQYPSGGPLPHLIDVWKAGAPLLDMLSPDIYFFNLPDWTQPYVRPDNALLVPEAMRSSRASANAMYVIAQQNAMGFSPFSIESIEDGEHNLLGQTYSALRHLTPLILERQGKGDLFGISPKVNYDGSVEDGPQKLAFGDYNLTVRFAGVPRSAVNPAELTSGDPAMRGTSLPPSGGMIIRTGPEEYIVVGNGMTILHTARDQTMQAGLLDVDEWLDRDGRWQHHRWLNGDQTNQGREVFLPQGSIGMIRVRLYQYR